MMRKHTAAIFNTLFYFVNRLLIKINERATKNPLEAGLIGLKINVVLF